MLTALPRGLALLPEVIMFTVIKEVPNRPLRTVRNREGIAMNHIRAPEEIRSYPNLFRTTPNIYIVRISQELRKPDTPHPREQRFASIPGISTKGLSDMYGLPCIGVTQSRVQTLSVPWNAHPNPER